MTLLFPGCLGSQLYIEWTSVCVLLFWLYSLNSSSVRMAIRRKPTNMTKGESCPWCSLAGTLWTSGKKLEGKIENNIWNLGVPKISCTQLRWFQGWSNTCIPRSESISMFLSQSMCSGDILAPNSTPMPDLHSSFLQPAPVCQWKWNSVGEGWLGTVACSSWHLSTPIEHRSAKLRCGSFLLSLLIQWKGKQVSLKNWLFRAVRLQNRRKSSACRLRSQ